MTTAAQAVRVARFSHKYAAELLLQTCDRHLQSRVGGFVEHGIAWTSAQWSEFSERHGLCKTLAAWESWAINNFDGLRQEMLDPGDSISHRSLKRICRGLHEIARAPLNLPRCVVGCDQNYDASICHECNACRTCQARGTKLPDGSWGCALHAVGRTPARVTISPATLLTWQ